MLMSLHNAHLMQPHHHANGAAAAFGGFEQANFTMEQSAEQQVQGWPPVWTHQPQVSIATGHGDVYGNGNSNSNSLQENSQLSPVSSESSDSAAGVDICEWTLTDTGLVCNQEFHDEDTYVKHVENHLNQTNRLPGEHVCYWYNCERDRKPFKAHYMLKHHVRIHTNHRPFVCDEPGCTKSYKRLENLRTHKRTHSGEKPFICQLGCGAAFTNTSDRAKHEKRTHSDNKPYQCEHCTKAYTDPSSKRKHMQKSHPEQFKQWKRRQAAKQQQSRSGQARRRSQQQQQQQQQQHVAWAAQPLRKRPSCSLVDARLAQPGCSNGHPQPPPPQPPPPPPQQQQRASCMAPVPAHSMPHPQVTHDGLLDLSMSNQLQMNQVRVTRAQQQHQANAAAAAATAAAVFGQSSAQQPNFDNYPQQQPTGDQYLSQHDVLKFFKGEEKCSSSNGGEDIESAPSANIKWQ